MIKEKLAKIERDKLKLPKGHPPIAKIEEALRQSGGIYTMAARKLGVTAYMVTACVERSPTLKAACKDIEDRLLDFTEGQLQAKIHEGSMAAITFYLRTKGKSRGYVERGEVTGAGGGPLQHEHAPRICLPPETKD